MRAEKQGRLAPLARPDFAMPRDRFVQHPLGYPKERAHERYRLRTTKSNPLALLWDGAEGIRGGLPRRGAGLGSNGSGRAGTSRTEAAARFESFAVY